jgi:hypothetical protein
VRFFVDTLKPFVDSHWRTRPAQIRGPQAGHVEVLAQPGLGLQPRLVERVDAVDAAMAPGEVARGAQHGLRIIEPRREGVLRQRAPQLIPQGVIGDVPDRQDVDAAFREVG